VNVVFWRSLARRALHDGTHTEPPELVGGLWRASKETVVNCWPNVLALPMLFLSTSWGSQDIRWVYWVSGSLGDNAFFLHVIAQKLHNARSWNLTRRCRLVRGWFSCIVCLNKLIVSQYWDDFYCVLKLALRTPVTKSACLFVDDYSHCLSDNSVITSISWPVRLCWLENAHSCPLFFGGQFRPVK